MKPVYIHDISKFPLLMVEYNQSIKDMADRHVLDKLWHRLIHSQNQNLEIGSLNTGSLELNLCDVIGNILWSKF